MNMLVSQLCTIEDPYQFKLLPAGWNGHRCHLLITKISTLTRETTQLKLMALISRVAILFVAGAMAFQQMGVGAEIINIAFGLILGAIAVAVAVAFGIGGRDIAASHLQKWTREIEGKE